MGSFKFESEACLTELNLDFSMTFHFSHLTFSLMSVYIPKLTKTIFYKIVYLGTRLRVLLITVLCELLELIHIIQANNKVLAISLAAKPGLCLSSGQETAD